MIEQKYYRQLIRVRNGKRKNVCRLCKRDLGSHWGQPKHCPNRMRERMLSEEDKLEQQLI